MKGWLERRNRTTVSVLGTGASLLVGVVDYVSGYSVNVVLLYFFPILAVTWYAGRGPGLLAAAIATAVWTLSQHLSLPRDPFEVVQIWNTAMRLLTFTGLSLLVFSFRKASDEALLSRIDSLTGAKNLRGFQERAREEIDRARRYGRPLTVAYLDLDNFKGLNDRLGHSEGDRVLREVVAAILGNIRGSDVIARVGGDEFVLLFPEADGEAAQNALRKIHQIVLLLLNEGVWPISLSVGAVTFSTPPDSVEELLDRADKAMYAAKNAGGNRIHHEQQ